MKKWTLLLLALPMAAHSSVNNYYDYEYKYVDENGMRQVTTYNKAFTEYPYCTESYWEEADGKYQVFVCDNSEADTIQEFQARLVEEDEKNIGRSNESIELEKIRLKAAQDWLKKDGITDQEKERNLKIIEVSYNRIDNAEAYIEKLKATQGDYGLETIRLRTIISHKNGITFLGTQTVEILVNNRWYNFGRREQQSQLAQKIPFTEITLKGQSGYRYSIDSYTGLPNK
ncbi:hypothetical protein P0F39_000248 [Vibrio metschnikovii]|uniref:hypothetical protein n=1 Tax=Vibrio sp. A14(2019) TaxID=2591428 RepID=UPI0027BF8319|nr:hypothetical protein [Vibrio sp. A14(2019)]EKO3778781.1 hypothetical protein [Vibrio metschnikovii]EKO3885674.1 hypothetical protein [Vibrio metschnikovii]EKO3937282.1 hypothetical protein [Vibrio metschnikovii]MDQ2188281.1 hypothetical protein [Vibrio sp. A14(2019)]